MQPFEKNNASLAARINKLIREWKQRYADFTQNVMDGNWNAARRYIQQGFPIYDIARNIISSIRMNNIQKEYRLNELIKSGAECKK